MPDDEQRPESEDSFSADVTEGAGTRGGTQEPTMTSGGMGTPDRSASMPDSIGSYRILGKLGEGEQQSPRRRVALKVVGGGRSRGRSCGTVLPSSPAKNPATEGCRRLTKP